ncbi:DUF6056 family protein [Clostridium saccharoperbutylacetonicum]|uniref:DUF6056 family protein n=1 Tax=Clostridium saccharoperbutylacetonicum TaxID=36745 RepID=UPI0012EB2A6F|nr:DUF6056 family protein [Clostridium saccharoperbutylacetonicum]NSB33725.1 hypothetical protein [Clostridium saccharoperbutylacetonicum]
MEKIKEKWSVFWKSEYAPFGYFAITLFVVMLKVGLKSGTDDFVDREELAKTTVFQWIYNHAISWQPRISSDTALALVNFNVTLWKLLTITLFTFMAMIIAYISTSRLADKNQKKNINLLICCSFFLFAPSIISNSVMWYTGSFHYLWPATAMVFALAPFCYAILGKSITYKNMYIVYFFASTFAAYVEQPFAVLLGFGAFTFLYLILAKKKIPKALVIQYIYIAINVTIYFLLGGVGNRSILELRWYRDYTMLSMPDKIFQGVNWSNYQLINSSNVLTLVFTTLIFVVIWKKNKDKVIRFFGSIPFIFMMLSVLPIDIIFKNVSYMQDPYSGKIHHLDIGRVLREGLFNCMMTRPNSFTFNLKALAPSIACLTILLFIAILLFFIFDKLEDKLIAVVLYFASLASSYVISFTPTVFASGERVFFITHVIIVLLIGMVARELFEKENILENKRFILYRGVLIFISACYALEQFAFGFMGTLR